MLALTLFMSIVLKLVPLLGRTQLGYQYCYNAFECVGTEWVISNYNEKIYGLGYKSLYGPTTSITANYQTYDVYCAGAFSCAQISFIQYHFYVPCSGSHSCANINGLSYINAKTVSCSGSNSCENSHIIAWQNVNCQGSQSCIYTNITAPLVYGSGAYSLYASMIDSLLVTDNTLKIYLRGYQSGFGATIICRTGDICNIYCYNNGCEMLYVECEQNSNCNILLNNNDPSITIPPITNINEYNYSSYDIKY
eukprot:469831_1